MLETICFNTAECLSIADILGASIGALLGFISAYSIFRLEQRKGEKTEEQRIRDLFTDVRGILDEANKAWLDTVKDYRTLSAKYEKDPYQLHMRVVSTNPAQLTLERLDRLALLEAFRRVMGLKAGREGWLALMELIDTMTEHRSLREHAVLSIMEDFNRQSVAFDDLCQELRATLIALLDTLPVDNPLVPDIKQIRDETQDVGLLTADKYHALIVQPVLGLVNAHMLPQTDHTIVLSLMYKAQTMYVRLKQSGMLLGTESKRFADEIAEYGKEVDSLLRRMKVSRDGHPDL